MADGFKLGAAARASFAEAFAEVIGRRFPGKRVIVGWPDEPVQSDDAEREGGES